MNRDDVDFANELCLEKVDFVELYCVTVGAAKPKFVVKVDSAEVHLAMVRADFEKYLPDVPRNKPLSPNFSSLLSLIFCLFLKAVL